MALDPGTRLGAYEIVSLLGSGGMGEVYRAWDPRLRREVAVKVLHENLNIDQSRLRRFEEEARATARLARPATVGLYSAASRVAYEAIERRARVGAPFVILARSGVDPVPYIARAHQSSVRPNAPLVLVDSTQAREHDVAVSYTRRDNFVDKETGEPVSLEVRVTKFVVQDNGTWKFAEGG